MKLKLDLHDVYNRGHDIDRALLDVIEEAVRTRATVVEIIPGKGSGQLKKRVLRFLDQKEIKAQYDRVEKDSRNFGRVFVHFRWKSGRRPSGPHVVTCGIQSLLKRVSGACQLQLHPGCTGPLLTDALEAVYYYVDRYIGRRTRRSKCPSGDASPRAKLGEKFYAGQVKHRS